jgi:hypothetical protein
MSFDMNAYLARAEQAVKDNLRGAQVIALIEIEQNVRMKPHYWERIYLAAWQRDDQCGTHRVCIDSKGQAACFIGHYDMSRDDAIADMLKRAA